MMVRATLFLLAIGIAAMNEAAAETRWFVVAEIDPLRNQSYLLPLSDPEQIDQARKLIEEGPGGSVGSIVSVRIAAGSDGFNRDVMQAGSPAWSWHVTELLGFADFTIELCDGWPGLVEQDVKGFIANTSGQVCFWSYTIVSELEQAPLFRIDPQVEGAWFDPKAPGQGVLLDVLPDNEQVFLAWFTYSPQRVSATAEEQRWFTAQGAIVDNAVEASVTVTTGGAFNQPTEVVNQPAGNLRLEFDDCNNARLEYALDSMGNGTIALQRIVPKPGCGLDSSTTESAQSVPTGD